MQTKNCTLCLVEKPFVEFNLDKSKRFSLASRCKKCTGAVQRAKNHTPEGKIKRKLAHIRRRYGLTEQNYLDLLQKSGWRCQICQRHEVERKLVVDHCHKTGKVRGVLCTDCNSLLGCARDNTEILECAKKYLQKHEH